MVAPSGTAYMAAKAPSALLPVPTISRLGVTKLPVVEVDDPALLVVLTT